MRGRLKIAVALLMAPLLVVSAQMTAYTQGVSCVSSICGGGGGAGGSFSGGTVTGATVFTSPVTFGTALDAANSVTAGETAGCITFEGSSADALENRLCVTNPGIEIITTIPAIAAAQTLMTLEGTQTASGAKTFSSSISFTSAVLLNQDTRLNFTAGQTTHLEFDTTNTPDAMRLGLSSTSNAFQLVEEADSLLDFNNGPCGTAACTHPTLNIHSATQNTTEYQGLSYFGTAGKAVKTLTESTATALVRIPVASNAAAGGMLEYGIFAADATDQQLRQGSIRYSVVNKAGTETCTLTAIDGTAVTNETNDGNAAALSAGTMTYTIACDATPANAVDLTFAAVSSLTQTTLEARWSISHVGPGLPAPQ